MTSNYIALTGALASIGERGGRPVPPLNLIGDFGGGGMLLAFGVVCALLEAQRSGVGQVVDAAMTDGAALLMASIYGLRASGRWEGGRGDNFLDGGAPFYRCYRCPDGRWVAIGAIEAKFFHELLERIGLGDDPLFGDPWDRHRWLAMGDVLDGVFAQRSRAEWCSLLEGTDVCFAPVLDIDEVTGHKHHLARESFIGPVGDLPQPAPAPRFSRSHAALREPDRAVTLSAFGLADRI